jgi:hypothetical protein
VALPRPLLTRAFVALVAAVLVAWSAVVWRDDNVGYSAANRIFNDPAMSDARWRSSLDQLRDADLLDYGTDWEVSRAQALLLRSRPAAERLAGSIVAREPNNIAAWVVLLRATRGRDPRTAARARAELERLDPLASAR